MVGKQSKQCKQNLDLMGTVSHAAYVAMDTCQGQFADRRWNCSSIRRTPKLSRDLTRGNRNCLAASVDFKLHSAATLPEVVSIYVINVNVMLL